MQMEQGQGRACESDGRRRLLGRALAATQDVCARDAQAGRHLRRCSTLGVEAADAIGAPLSCFRVARQELLRPQVALLPVGKSRPSAAKARVARVPLSVAAQADHAQPAALARDGHRLRAPEVAELAHAKAAIVKADAVLQVKRKALGEVTLPVAVSDLGTCWFALHAPPPRARVVAAAGVALVVGLIASAMGKGLVGRRRPAGSALRW